MKANTKKIIVVGSVIGAVAIIVTAFIMRSRRKKLEEKIQAGSIDVIVPAKDTTSSVIFPLKRGSGKLTAENNAVKVVQRYINARGIEQWWLQLTPLNEDGLFGPLTEAALSKLAGVKEVSYSFYKEMQTYLYRPPVYLNPDTPAYKAPANWYSFAEMDPKIAKNNLV